MKKITLCILLMLISLKIQAQLTNGNFTSEVDARIKNLSKTSITSNILIDRVFPVAGIQAFNQGTRKDTANVTHFKQAWSELYRASYSKNFASIETFKQQLKAKSYAKNVIPIGIINTEFHEGNFGTTTQNANVGFNSSTGLFTNISGKNPFTKKQTTIIAPLVTKASGKTITFTTDNLFKLHKYGKRIKTLRLYTNNTSFTLINNYNLVNANFSTTYSGTSTQTLRFAITYSDNTTKTTYGTVKTIKPTTYAQRGVVSQLDTINADDDLLFQGYEENQAYKGKNEYRIYYDTQNNNQVVNKPLYIIDGYDPNDARKIQASDYDNYDPIEDESLIELMKYGDDINLISSLNDKGFDVIVVNHPVYDRGSKTIDGGSDYIERNAYTFISLMRYIKSIQQGNEKAVVIGPSMGGLITRYALAYMEKKLAETGDNAKWNHNTRLWVSFDSPHQGANIPIGVQKGIQYFADELEVEGAKAFINEELSKPAPKQMLVNHYTNNTSLPIGAPNFRNRFQNALDNLGMPNNLRKVALINGSIFGNLNGVSSAKYLEIDDNLSHLGPLMLITNVFYDKFKANFYNTTNQKSGNGETFTFDGGVRGKFLWWTWWTKRTSYKSLPKSKGSYDISPGGYFNAQQLLVNETTNPSTDFTWYLLNWTFHNLNSTLIDPASSFIPTKSSLAYTGSNVLDEVIGTKDRVCSGETPFDSYFAPQENEDHIFLTTKNVAWLTKEIEGNEQPTTVYITGGDLKGADRICPTATEVYSFSNCQFNAASWEVSNNLSIVWSNSTRIAVKLKTGLSVGVINDGKGNTYGTGIITAINENTSVTKKVSIGNHLFTNIAEIPASSIQHIYPIAPSGATDIGLQLNFNASNREIEKIEWQKVSNNFTWTQDNNLYGNDNRVIISKSCNSQIHFKVRIKNSCGWSNWQDIFYDVTSCTTNCSNGSDGNTSGVNSTNFDVYPVPAKTNLTVKIKNQDPAMLQNGEVFKAKLYNKAYRVTREVNGNANSITIYTTDLPTGSYVLTIQYNSIYESHTILID
tara:strand:+ start:1207 stop:4305 length:3099 start_codon:yes stop_codon:yes gene_type:complete